MHKTVHDNKGVASLSQIKENNLSSTKRFHDFMKAKNLSEGIQAKYPVLYYICPTNTQYIFTISFS
jgi:hypothetical protein